MKVKCHSRNHHPRYFFALCLTRVSNTWLLIGLWAVWKGFIIVYERIRVSVFSLSLIQFEWKIKIKIDLYIQLPDVHEERLDSIIILPFMQQHKLHIWQEFNFSKLKIVNLLFLTSWRNKGRHRPFIEFVNCFEIPVGWNESSFCHIIYFCD